MHGKADGNFDFNEWHFIRLKQKWISYLEARNFSILKNGGLIDMSGQRYHPPHGAEWELLIESTTRMGVTRVSDQFILNSGGINKQKKDILMKKYQLLVACRKLKNVNRPELTTNQLESGNNRPEPISFRVLGALLNFQMLI